MNRNSPIRSICVISTCIMCALMLSCEVVNAAAVGGVPRDEESANVAWDQLRRIVNDDKQSDRERLAAFVAMCDNGDRSQINSIARELLPEWMSRVTKQQADFRSSRVAVPRLPAMFVSELFLRVAREPHKGWTDSPEHILTAIEHALAGDALVLIGNGDGSSVRSFADVLKAATHSPRQRSRVVEQVFSRNPVIGVGGDEQLIELLDDESIEKLRTLLVTHPSEPEKYPHATADALSHLGDEQSIAALRNTMDLYSGMTSENLQISRFPRDSFVSGFRARIRRIELQHPPTRLLELVREPSDGLWGATRDRLWAVRRATVLGVDKSLIRDAVLEYSGRIISERINGRERKLVLGSLSHLKSECVAQGVLNPEDLPTVPDVQSYPYRLRLD